MNAQEAREVLTQSLADRKISGGERRALAGWFDSQIEWDHDRGLLRHIAFDLARNEVADPQTTAIFEWLEDILKLIAPIESMPRESRESPKPGLVLFAPGEAILNHLSYRFQCASRVVDICVFTITDDRVSRAILDAHHRGVRIRIISDREKSHDLGSDISRFHDAGIRVKLHHPHGPPSAAGGGHMHHKFAIFDDTYLINGSYNWTRGAVHDNFENLVELTDLKIVETFQEEFGRLWNRF